MNAAAKVIGLDIAKNVLVAVGQDEHGKVAWKRSLSRDAVLSTLANMPAPAIGIE
jgi:hypothetical protein